MEYLDEAYDDDYEEIDDVFETGFVVSISIKSIPHHKEIVSWCKESIHGDWSYDCEDEDEDDDGGYNCDFYFEKESDANWFKLKWA